MTREGEIKRQQQQNVGFENIYATNLTNSQSFSK